MPESTRQAQETGGARALLSVPILYELIQWLLGGHRARRHVVSEHVQPRPAMRILDIGCGTGHVLSFLPSVAYSGFDVSPAYIQAARKRFGDRGDFYCTAVTTATLAGQPPFERVLALGVLHHLDDAAAVALLQLAREGLAENGRLVTLDPLLTPAQPWLGRRLISWERGRHVRTKAATQALFEGIFANHEATVYPRLLGYPYYHLVMEAGE